MSRPSWITSIRVGVEAQRKIRQHVTRHWTGSLAIARAIGMVDVAAFAESAARMALATITAA